MKRVIIAGGRDFGNRTTEAGGLDVVWQRKCVDQMYSELAGLFEEELEWGGLLVVSGHAPGTDQMGEMWADEHMFDVELHPADWDTHGKAAGFRRNVEMVNVSQVLVAFWDGKSRGTKHTIDNAIKQGLEVHIYPYEKS